jgi:hypothetical protein
MKHLRTICVKPADSKQFDDPAASIFFQVWLSVMTFIITGALGEK